MQQTDATYKALFAAGAPADVRALIWITEGANAIINSYENARIVSATTKASMLESELTIGNCIAKKLHLVLANYAGMRVIPRMARIRMQYRLNDGVTQSDWYPKGTYWIDTRAESDNGVLEINAYDAMLRAEQPFMQSGNQGQWPRSDYIVADQIATRISAPLDPRTAEIITHNYEIQYPGYGEGAYTCREVLSFIGQMYGGNWIITDENRLRLIILGDIPDDSTNYLVTQNGDYITMGGDRIRVSR